MRIGWNGGGSHTSLETLRDEAKQAAENGFSSLWLSQIAGPDALTAIAAIAADAPGIELGTSIVPVYGRHPLVIAQQALTAQAACGGRLTLGIGASHQLVVEGMLGESYGRPFTRTRETFRALRSLLAGEAAEIEGKEITARGKLAIDAEPCPILISALGPRALELAGAEADGTTLWMVGPNTVRDHIAPRIREAAAAADRPAPRILAGFPVCVTDDPAGAREHAAGALAMYGMLPAYRTTLDREGIEGPEGMLAAGSEDQVRDHIAAFAEAGATDLRLSPMCANKADRERTLAFLCSIAGDRFIGNA